MRPSKPRWVAVTTRRSRSATGQPGRHETPVICRGERRRDRGDACRGKPASTPRRGGRDGTRRARPPQAQALRPRMRTLHDGPCRRRASRPSSRARPRTPSCPARGPGRTSAPRLPCRLRGESVERGARHDLVAAAVLEQHRPGRRIADPAQGIDGAELALDRRPQLLGACAAYAATGDEPPASRSNALMRRSTPATMAPVRAPVLQPTRPSLSSSTVGRDRSTSPARRTAMTSADRRGALRGGASSAGGGGRAVGDTRRGDRQRNDASRRQPGRRHEQLGAVTAGAVQVDDGRKRALARAARRESRSILFPPGSVNETSRTAIG